MPPPSPALSPSSRLPNISGSPRPNAAAPHTPHASRRFLSVGISSSQSTTPLAAAAAAAPQIHMKLPFEPSATNLTMGDPGDANY